MNGSEEQQLDKSCLHALPTYLVITIHRCLQSSDYMMQQYYCIYISVCTFGTHHKRAVHSWQNTMIQHDLTQCTSHSPQVPYYNVKSPTIGVITEPNFLGRYNLTPDTACNCNRSIWSARCSEPFASLHVQQHCFGRAALPPKGINGAHLMEW